MVLSIYTIKNQTHKGGCEHSLHIIIYPAPSQFFIRLSKQTGYCLHALKGKSLTLLQLSPSTAADGAEADTNAALQISSHTSSNWCETPRCPFKHHNGYMYRLCWLAASWQECQWHKLQEGEEECQYLQHSPALQTGCLSGKGSFLCGTWEDWR